MTAPPGKAPATLTEQVAELYAPRGARELCLALVRHYEAWRFAELVELRAREKELPRLAGVARDEAELAASLFRAYRGSAYLARVNETELYEAARRYLARTGDE